MNLPLQVKGLPPDDKIEDDSEEDEDEESKTDEETVLVTSSGQALGEKIKFKKGIKDRDPFQAGAGGLPEDPNDPLGEGGMGDMCRGP